MHQQASQLLTDISNASLQLQRIILKIFYALIEVLQLLWYAMLLLYDMQYHLPLTLLNENTIPGWMHILHSIIDRQEPKVSASCDCLVTVVKTVVATRSVRRYRMKRRELNMNFGNPKNGHCQ